MIRANPRLLCMRTALALLLVCVMTLTACRVTPPVPPVPTDPADTTGMTQSDPATEPSTSPVPAPETDAATVPETGPITLPDTVPDTEPITAPDTAPDTPQETDPVPPPETEPAGIKNIIFLIPDGAGFGTYDLANALKTTYGTGVYGQATPVTRDAIDGMTVEGLYLDQFMIASADTSLATPYGGGAPTDSAAAGTALLGGYKTNFLMVGVDPGMNPRANLLELCRLSGKATGFVTTKCLVDATPTTATAHSLKRADQDRCAYQFDVSLQLLHCGIDVLLAYGSDGGYIDTKGQILHDDRASNHGYTVVSDRSQLLSAVYVSGAPRIFSNFHTPDPAHAVEYSPMYDYQAHHIPYDCDAKADDLTLLDMAKAAIHTLAENVNDEDGFCLVIEGGAIDNAAERRYAREAVGEYLAFDEVFGWCVNWAMARGDTIVVACPDHDSGGIYAPEKLKSLLHGLRDGLIGSEYALPGAATGHTGQNVPVWLWAPEEVRAEIIASLGLPADVTPDRVRSGRFYDGVTFDPSCVISNAAIAPAVAAAAGLMTFDQATEELFARADEFGSYDPDARTFTFRGGEKVVSCSDCYTDAAGNVHPFACGMAFYLTNPAAYSINVSPAAPPNTLPNAFYVPRSVLIEMGYAAPAA